MSIQARKTGVPVTSLSFGGEEARTKQSFKDECDINFIINRYRKTGVLEHVRQAIPTFADVPVIDYHEAMNTVVQGKALFESLPAKLRKECDNDPGKFLELLHSEQAEETLGKYGLLEPAKPAPDPMRVHVVNNDPPPPAE